MLPYAFVLVFVLGLWGGWAWARRRIDHRWYCGRFHPASDRCTPEPEYIERHRRVQERFARADALEDEARRLRKQLT